MVRTAFTLSLRRNYDLEEYKKIVEFFLKAGVDHYVMKIDKNIGPKTLEYIKYFQERHDLDCRMP